MVLADFCSDHVPNGLITMGMVAGLFGSLWQNGVGQVLQSFLSISISFFLLYPLFKIGGLGAGDVKMFLTVATFFPVRDILTVIAGAFVIGAFFSIGKLLAEKNGRERLQYFLSYMRDVLYTRQWKIYGENFRQDYYRYQKNKIHFTLPIFLSVFLRLAM